MATLSLWATQVLLAQEPTPGTTPSPTPNSTGAEFGKSGPIGLVIVLLLLIGVILLIRSMNRHMHKLPATFDAATEDGAETTDHPAG